MTETGRDACTCHSVSRHDGVEAKRYMDEHLEEVRVDSERWTVEYRCPKYGKRWLADQPQGEMHGGGPFRLRTLDAVCRDLRLALATVSTLVPDNATAQEAATVIEQVLGNCADYAR